MREKEKAVYEEKDCVRERQTESQRDRERQRQRYTVRQRGQKEIGSTMNLYRSQ